MTKNHTKPNTTKKVVTAKATKVVIVKIKKEVIKKVNPYVNNYQIDILLDNQVALHRAFKTGAKTMTIVSGFKAIIKGKMKDIESSILGMVISNDKTQPINRNQFYVVFRITNLLIKNNVNNTTSTHYKVLRAKQLAGMNFKKVKTAKTSKITKVVKK